MAYTWALKELPCHEFWGLCMYHSGTWTLLVWHVVFTFLICASGDEELVEEFTGKGIEVAVNLKRACFR